MQQDSEESNGRPENGPMSSAERKLRTLLEDAGEVDALIGTLRAYVYRANLAAGGQVDEVAHEVLSEVVVEALRSVDRFDPERSARAWLLGIGAKVILRHKDRAARRSGEIPMSGLPVDDERGADTWLFEHVTRLREMDVTAAADDDDAVRRLLAPLAEQDRVVVRHAILHEMNGVEIAQALGISPGSARQRLHRALGRLRITWAERNDRGYER